MHILVSNDDGVNAKGIKSLAEAMKEHTDVTIVAPDRNRSGSSSALTLDQPLRCKQLDNGYYSISGTPCDCIHLGSHRLMKSKPDMVIAGINHGANLGDDVFYSGTVAAAMEGRSLGYPAVAISLASRECQHFATAAWAMKQLIIKLQKNPLKSNIILNVNVPDISQGKVKGFKLTRLGCRHRADTIVPATDPRGETVYWIGPPSEPQDIGEGTDFAAVENNYISITPLVVDLTAQDNNKSLQSWIAGI